MLGFASCNNTEEYIPTPSVEGVTSEGSSMRLSMVMPRAVGQSQNEAPVAIQTGRVIFSNATRIIQTIDLTEFTAVGTAFVYEATNLPGGISQVHFVGNPDAETLALAVPGSDNLATLMNHLVTVGSQMNTVATTGPQGQTAAQLVNVWASATALGASTINATTGNESFNVGLTARPIVARVELFNITGGGNIREFTVEGIFMDNLYTHGRVSGTAILPAADAPWRSIGLGTAASIANFAVGSPFFPTAYATSGVLYDAVGTPATPVNNPGYWAHGWPRVVPPAGGAVWGYNLFAHNSRMPRIAIRLSNVWLNQEVTVQRTLNVGDILEGPNFPTDPTDYVIVSVPTVQTSDVVVARIPHGEARTETVGWTPPTATQIIGWVTAHGWNTPAFLAAVRAHYEGRWTATTYPLFISINGFRTPGTTGTTGVLDNFIAGMVYQLGSYSDDNVGGSQWYFDEDDLQRIPFIADIDINVTVTPMTWVHVPVEPIL